MSEQPFQVGDRVKTNQGRGTIVGYNVDNEGEWLLVKPDGDPDATVWYDPRDVDIEYRPINDPSRYDAPLFDLTEL